MQTKENLDNDWGPRGSYYCRDIDEGIFIGVNNI